MRDLVVRRFLFVAIATGFMLLCALACLPPVALASTLRGRMINGQVLYGRRSCTSAPPSSQAAVAGAELLLRPAHGAALLVRLDGSGRFHVRLPNALPVKAWLVLSDSRLEVAPLATGAPAYHIPLGAIAFRHGKQLVLRRRLVLVGAKFDGAANIWTVLHEGAVVAAAASPVRLPAVTARWTYGEDLAAGTTHYDPSDLTIVVGAAPGTSAQGEWEPWVLLHEYAHHLLHIVADPNSPGGSHAFNSVHPKTPALPWDEGFADAFAAIVQQDPIMKVDCRWQADMSTEPAHPLPVVPAEAQYNEGAIAGTLWHLAAHLAPGNPTHALAPILAALRPHPAHSMREFRDALAEDPQVESNPAQQEAIDFIFADQSIGWGISVASQPQASEGANPALAFELGAKVDGPSPYSPCKLGSDLSYPPSYASPYTYGKLADGQPYPIPIAGQGGLPFAWQSDCLTSTDGLATPITGTGPTDGGGYQDGLQFQIPFPYAGPTANNPGMYTISLYEDCAPEPYQNVQCPKTFTEHLTIRNGAPLYLDLSGKSNVTLSVSVTLSLDSWTPIVEFDQTGYCKVLTTGQPCSD